MREWSAIAAAAGAPAPRLAEEKERLFGAAKPKVVFWRDNSMWCPYCARLWLLLEALRVPYATKTIPLSRYLRPGEKKPAEYTSQVPSGVVPALQFEQADGTYGPAVDGVARLFDALLKDSTTAVPPSEALEAVLPRFEMARRGYEACAGAPTRLAPDACFDMGVGEACATLDAALAGFDCAFPRGLSPSDCKLLPLLERLEAVLPYFFGDGAFERLPFGRARAYLEGARAHTFFGAIASDRTTLARTNLRYANPHFAPDAGAARLIDHEGAACTAEDRRDAAARLATNHAAVAKFALRASSSDNRPDETLVAAVDDALRATADSLLGGDAELPPGPPRVADALLALSYNVGVPRDMARGPAAAFRGALRDLAAQQATPPRAPDGKWETAGNGDCWLKFTWCLGAGRVAYESTNARDCSRNSAIIIASLVPNGLLGQRGQHRDAISKFNDNLSVRGSSPETRISASLGRASSRRRQPRRPAHGHHCTSSGVRQRARRAPARGFERAALPDDAEERLASAPRRLNHHKSL